MVNLTGLSWYESVFWPHISCLHCRYHDTAHQVVTIPSLIDPTAENNGIDELGGNSKQITGLCVKGDKVFLATKVGSNFQLVALRQELSGLCSFSMFSLVSTAQT